MMTGIILTAQGLTYLGQQGNEEMIGTWTQES